MKINSIPLTSIVEQFNLRLLNHAALDGIAITSPDFNRIGLPLAGFLKDFANDRIQIVGMVEWRYMQTLDDDRLRIVVGDILERDIPCLIFSRDLRVPQIVTELADIYNVPILKTSRATTSFVADLLKFIDSQLTESTTVHGVLIDINGIGTLITGKSGVGKSETALELVKRGHRFVADDAIQISKMNDTTLIGRSPELIKNFMEIRGIGIVDMSKMYGIGSVRDSMHIDLIVQIEEWSDESTYDRLGLDDVTETILGQPVPKLLLPVKPGRNLAVILEAAARNQSLKRMGYHAAKELDEKIRQMNQ